MDFVDCLLHLDDTPLESGCLEVVPGSHHQGPLEHVTGADTAPHLPTNQFHPDFVETIKTPTQAGDVIFSATVPFIGQTATEQTNGGNRSDLATIVQLCDL